jgi:hypothetical protein
VTLRQKNLTKRAAPFSAPRAFLNDHGSSFFALLPYLRRVRPLGNRDWQERQEEPVNALREIVRTCSNAHIARAALVSIGGDFADRFAADATRREMGSGVLAARFVRAFAKHAPAGERQSVEALTRGADQPILAGLRYILDIALRAEAAYDEGAGDTPPAWAINAALGLQRGE